MIDSGSTDMCIAPSALAFVAAGPASCPDPPGRSALTNPSTRASQVVVVVAAERRGGLMGSSTRPTSLRKQGR
jgi:hypothetical protein